MHLKVAFGQQASGRLAKAETLYRRALQAEPKNAAALQLLALLLAQTGRPEMAVDLFRDAVALRPESPELQYNLANALQAAGRLDAAAMAYRRALELRPEFAEAYVNLADVLLRLGERDEAVVCGERAVALGVDIAEAHNNFGNALREGGELTAATEAYGRALALNPRLAAAHNNLGAVLQQQGRLRDAVACYRRALAYRPDYVEAFHNLGNALWETGSLEKAIASYRRAVEIDPDFAPAVAQLAHVKAHICDWRDAEAESERVLALMRRDPAQVPPFNLLEQRSTPADQLLCARQWSQRLATGRRAFSHHRRRAPHRKIRVAYLSADFRDHPVGHAMVETIERHNRARFDVIGYSYGPDDGSELRRRFAAGFDRFNDLGSLGDKAAAEVIYREEVDILIDLTGYTRYGRLGILATRPAPIQVAFLGFLGTTGADFIDYIIVDRFVAPQAQQELFSERLAQLAECWWPAAIRPEIAARPISRADYGIAADAFVFCCFNRSSKLSPQIFDVWMRLLRLAPHSVLWLAAGARATERNLRNEAARRGVAPERVVFAPREPMAEYLARQRLADLFVDTSPYNACTTAYYALWAGLPVLTCAGDTFAGRTAGTLLQAVGLPELVATSLSAYEAQALRLARSRDELVAFRERLARARMNAPLFNADRFARDVESAFERMHQIWRAGEPPRPFSLAAAQ
jgi:predicted O-linked N-acetylglucosamine transferase (SPINDLY family)